MANDFCILTKEPRKVKVIKLAVCTILFGSSTFRICSILKLPATYQEIKSWQFGDFFPAGAE